MITALVQYQMCLPPRCRIEQRGHTRRPSLAQHMVCGCLAMYPAWWWWWWWWWWCWWCCVCVCLGGGGGGAPNDFNQTIAFTMIHHHSTALFALQQCSDLPPRVAFPAFQHDKKAVRACVRVCVVIRYAAL